MLGFALCLSPALFPCSSLRWMAGPCAAAVSHSCNVVSSCNVGPRLLALGLAEKTPWWMLALLVEPVRGSSAVLRLSALVSCAWGGSARCCELDLPLAP